MFSFVRMRSMAGRQREYEPPGLMTILAANGAEALQSTPEDRGGSACPKQV